MTIKRRDIVMVLVPVGFLGACSSPPPLAEGPTAVTVGFVENYDEWARNGYDDPIPETLREAASTEMLEVLEDDQDWYLDGGIKQHGEVKIIETELIESDDYHAIISVTLDATAVTVTAEGEETWVDYSQPIVTRFSLEKGNTWRVTSTETDE